MASGQFYGWQKQEDITREALRVFNMSLIIGRQLSELGVGSSLFSFDYITIIKMYSNFIRHPLTAIEVCDESVFPGSIYLDCLSHPTGSQQAVLKAAFICGELHHHRPPPQSAFLWLSSPLPVYLTLLQDLWGQQGSRIMPWIIWHRGRGPSSRGFPSLWHRDCLGGNGSACLHGKISLKKDHHTSPHSFYFPFYSHS